MGDARPADTSPRAWELTREAYARLGPESRVRAAFQASEFLREITRAGIKVSHPEFDDERVARELFRRIYGDSLSRKVFPEAGE
jgi:hypothetical protein